MSVVENIRTSFLKRKIKKFNSKYERKVKLKEFKDVKTVGVIFNASDEQKCKRATHLIGHFQGLQKKVSAVGLINTKEDPHYIENTLSYNYIRSSDINWYNYPKSVFIDDFIKTRFDLLIDLNFEKIPSLRYIAETSLANCKIGLNQNGDDLIYDFMLEGIPPNEMNMFLKQILYYLELIKTQ